jgi:hypothetical protein
MTEPSRVLPFPYCAASKATHDWTDWAPSANAQPGKPRVTRKCRHCGSQEDTLAGQETTDG